MVDRYSGYWAIKLPIVEEIDKDCYIGVRLGGMGVAIGSYLGKLLVEKQNHQMRLFTREKYEQRRTALVGQLTRAGMDYGNGESAANYKDNTFPFRQNSNFLYYFGINAPDLHATIDRNR